MRTFKQSFKQSMRTLVAIVCSVMLVVSLTPSPAYAAGVGSNSPSKPTEIQQNDGTSAPFAPSQQAAPGHKNGTPTESAMPAAAGKQNASGNQNASQSQTANTNAPQSPNTPQSKNATPSTDSAQAADPHKQNTVDPLTQNQTQAANSANQNQAQSNIPANQDRSAASTPASPNASGGSNINDIKDLISQSGEPVPPLRSEVIPGHYQQGTYTVTANLFIPQTKNPIIPVQAYINNPANPLRLIEPDNGPNPGPSDLIPNVPLQNNAQLKVDEKGDLYLTLRTPNPVFTLQAIGDGQNIQVVDKHTRTGEYGVPNVTNPSAKPAKVDYHSRIDKVTFKLGKTYNITDGKPGYRLSKCLEYPTIIGRTINVDLELTVDLSRIPTSDAYAPIPTVNTEALVYNFKEQTGVAVDLQKCDIVSGEYKATNVGNYSVTVRPKAGNKWIDGTTAEKTFKWSIEKLEIHKIFEMIVPLSTTPQMCFEGSCQSLDPLTEDADADTVKNTVMTLLSMPQFNDLSKLTVRYEGMPQGMTPDQLKQKGFVGKTVSPVHEFENLYVSSIWNIQSINDNGVKPPCDVTAFNLEGADTDTPNVSISTVAHCHLTLLPGQEPKEHIDLIYNGKVQVPQSKSGRSYMSSVTGKDNYWDDYSRGPLSLIEVRRTKDVGTYEAKVGPYQIRDHGYDSWWSDGTNIPKTITWTIKPAKLTVTPLETTIVKGDVASLNCDVSGFVEHESAADAADYQEPVCYVEGHENESLSTLAPGEYTIKAKDGHARNYEFEYKIAKLRILADASIAALPRIAEHLVYNGREQQGVSESSSYTLTGAKAVDAGTYKAIATLNEGVTKWSDGSTEKTRTFTWKIEKAKLTARFIPVEFDNIAGYLKLQKPYIKVYVDGFVPGENPAFGNVAGYQEPAVYRFNNLTCVSVEHDAQTNQYRIGNTPINAGEGTCPNNASAQGLTNFDNNLASDKIKENPFAYTDAIDAAARKSAPYATSDFVPDFAAGIALIPALGAAKNYTFGYIPGSLSLQWANDGEEVVVDNQNYYVFSSKPKLAEVPCVVPLVYTGKKQQGVFAQYNSTILNATGEAVDAGVYSAKVQRADSTIRWNSWATDISTLGNNFANSNKIINVPWKIEKAPLQAIAPTVSVTAGDALPSLKAQVYGFVPGESADNASDYKAPQVTLPNGVTSSTLRAGATYVLNVQGGASKNYMFRYTQGRLTVLPQGKLAQPTVADNLIENGQEQRGVQENPGWVLSGDVTASKAGTYHVTVTPKSGYTWSDRSTSARSIEWTIHEKQKQAEPPTPPVPPAPTPSVPGGSTNPSETQDDTHIKPGTYTVSANIWFDKHDTGLPLNPHITNAAFPPMNPVAQNATLVVNEDGQASVTVPIAIQPRIMHVKSISGLNITNMITRPDSSAPGDDITSITINLGTLKPGQTDITQHCTVRVHLGETAAMIAGAILGGVLDHNWPATFNMRMSGLPSSGGGSIPPALRDKLNHILSGNQQQSGTSDNQKGQAQSGFDLTSFTPGTLGIAAKKGVTVELNGDVIKQSDAASGVVDVQTCLAAGNVAVEGILEGPNVPDGSVCNITTAALDSMQVASVAPAIMQVLGKELADPQAVAGVFDVSLNVNSTPVHDNFGNLVLSFPASPEYNGKQVKVWHFHANNTVTSEICTVKDGCFSIAVSDLSKFAYALLENVKQEAQQARQNPQIIDASSVPAIPGDADQNAQGGAGAGGADADASANHIAAGTYTVSANIWFDKHDTGLPLNPHITNPGFPPMNPVANNARLVVNEAGEGWVTIPIAIQSRIMNIQSISGLNITQSDYSDGGLRSITVYLGVLSGNRAAIVKHCSATVRIGDLAMTIAGAVFKGERMHTWPATFSLNFSGLPRSGGGRVPDVVKNYMAGAHDNTVANAEEAALDALGDSSVTPQNDADTSTRAQAKSKGIAPDQSTAMNASTVAGIVVVVLALAALCAYAIVRSRKLRQQFTKFDDSERGPSQH